MFNMTENEPVKGWADIQPTRHLDQLLIYAIRAWKRVAVMANLREDGLCSQEEVEEMIDLAETFERLHRNDAECKCVLPEQSCEVCRAVARIVYEEDVI